MNQQRSLIIENIIRERVRQVEMPGSEWDAKNTPNDWVAIASHYLVETVKKRGATPNSEEFQDNVTKAAAILLAALEHIDVMKEHKTLI
jgi:hypothetical protein